MTRPAVVVGLLFVIAIVSYADRQVIALLKPLLDREFGWRAQDYATIAAWSQAATALSLLASGWLVDRIGVRASLGAGLAGWSLMTVLHAWAGSVRAFLLLRVGLGMFEGVGTPAMMKAVADRVAPAARGRVIGLLNAAPNLAAMATPLIVGACVPALGWRGTIAALGLFGLLCAVPWLLIRSASAPAVETQAAAVVLDTGSDRRAIVVFALAKFITDPVWWFMLFWLPDLLHRRFGLQTAELGVPVGAAYLMAAIGSLAGGSLPPVLARRGLRPEMARRVVMGGAACLAMALPVALWGDSLVLTVTICGLTLAAHQIFAANLFGFAADRVSPVRIGRATGIGAFCGNVGGAIGLRLAGVCAASTLGFLPVLFYGALAYAAAWILMSLTIRIPSPAPSSSLRAVPAR